MFHAWVLNTCGVQLELPIDRSDEYCIEIVKPEFDPLLVLGYAIAMDNVEHESKKLNAMVSGLAILSEM
jgi:hypothetical protein